MFGFVSGAPLPRCGRPVAPSRVLKCSVAAETHDLDGVAITGPLRPAGQHILVKNAKAAEKTVGGLILATDAKDKPTHGTAVAVGPGKYFPAGGLIPMAVSQGDSIVYGKFGGTDVKFDGEKHVIITQDEVMCTLEGGVYEASAVRPIHDRIFVKVDKPAEELKSGILLSSGTAEKPTTGTIVATGTGRVMENGEIEPMVVSPGDKVLYGQYSGTDVKFGDEEYLFLYAIDIYAHWKA